MKIRHILEGKTTKVTPPKPRNFVAKNAVQSGAGAHKDKKKAAKQGDVKHKGKEMDLAEASLDEYGDTARGQKMLGKVQKRAVDRMIKADDKRDAKTAKKNQDTANRAWDRMTDKDIDETFTDDVKDTVSKVGDAVANALPKEMRPFDNQTAANFSSNISKQPATAKTKVAVRESTRNPDLMSTTDYDRYQQSQMDQQKRDFKRDELEHELGHEDRGMYWVMVAKNGKWEYTKAQPRQEGMNPAMRLISALHAKYPGMHLGMQYPNGKVENFGKGRK